MRPELAREVFLKTAYRGTGMLFPLGKSVRNAVSRWPWLNRAAKKHPRLLRELQATFGFSRPHGFPKISSASVYPSLQKEAAVDRIELVKLAADVLAEKMASINKTAKASKALRRLIAMLKHPGDEALAGAAESAVDAFGRRMVRYGNPDRIMNVRGTLAGKAIEAEQVMPYFERINAAAAPMTNRMMKRWFKIPARESEWAEPIVHLLEKARSTGSGVPRVENSFRPYMENVIRRYNPLDEIPISRSIPLG